jgi:hypothetical protein
MFARLWLLVVLSAGLIPVAFAQRGGGGRGGQDTGPAFGAPSGDTKLDRIGDLLHLSREQKKNVEQIFDAAQKEAAPLREQIATSRENIATAMIDQKSQQEIDPLLASHGTLLAQMTGVELRALAQVVGILKEDQRKRIAPLLNFMNGMFTNRNWNTTVR